MVIDIAICALLLVIGVPPTLSGGDLGAGTWADTALLPTLVVPVMLSRRHPLAAAAVYAAACVVSGAPTFDQFRLVVAIPAALVVLVRLARHSERRPALAGLAVVLVGFTVVAFTDVAIAESGGVVSAIAYTYPLFIGVWICGRALHSRDRLTVELTEQSRLLERRREETAALAVEVDRIRVAGELRTTLRDRVAELVALAADDPAGATERFARIERLGRESLNELRGILGVLRSDEPGVRAPRPTLADLETLLADARRGGRLVDLEVYGTRPALASGVELAAYRVLQHSLVAIRGMGTESATVALRYLPEALELEVSGSPSLGPGPMGAIAAARERTRAHGGTFHSEDSAGRRTLISRLPLGVAHA